MGDSTLHGQKAAFLPSLLRAARQGTKFPNLDNPKRLKSFNYLAWANFQLPLCNLAFYREGVERAQIFSKILGYTQ